MNPVDEERYPVGKFTPPTAYTPEVRAEYIATLKLLPEQLRAAVAGLNNSQLDTPYRDGGWTIRQVVHHFADSHANCLIRFKLALTEDNPTIKPYSEAAWAKTADSLMPVEPSLAMVDGMHARLVALLESMSEEDFKRTFAHPERSGAVTLATNLGIYAWHSRHHLAHITRTRARLGV